mgnify:CR=1 FL=1
MNHDLHTGRPERRPVGTIAFPGGTDFAPEMTPAQVGAYSTLALAHIGDGVYELMMRTQRRPFSPRSRMRSTLFISAGAMQR